MALAKTDDTYYKNIADAIRANLAGSGSEEEQYAPSEMSEGVQAVADYNLVKGYNAGLEAVPKEDCDCFTEEQFNAVVDAAKADSVPKMSLIDQADWTEDGVPQWWIDTEITPEEFSRLTGGKYSFTKTKGSGYAYDFGRQYNRFYMEKSGNGWGGHGGGQYGKYALTADSTPVPDPDFKDWDIVRDDNGNLVSMTPKSFNSSVPQKLPNGHIVVPSTAEAYEMESANNRRRYAMSYGCYEDKTAALRAGITGEINEKVNNTASAVKTTVTGTLLELDDIDSNATVINVKTEPNSVVRMTAPNMVYTKEVETAGTGSWLANQINVYPPRNCRLVLSCDFENIGGTTVGIAIKPDNKSVVTEPQSKSASGSLRTVVDVGEYASIVALRFYSNYSNNAVASECKFTNILCYIEEMDVDNDTAYSAVSTYTADENGEVVIKAPKYSPVLVYSDNGSEVTAMYSQNISKRFATLEQIGDIEAALDELHAYAVALTGGEA